MKHEFYPDQRLLYILKQIANFAVYIQSILCSNIFRVFRGINRDQPDNLQMDKENQNPVPSNPDPVIQDQLVENLSKVRSLGVALAYIVLRNLDDAEETFKEVTKKAVEMQDQKDPGLENFKHWFWETLIDIIEKRVSYIAYPGIIQKHGIEDITIRFRAADIPPRVAYKTLINAANSLSGDPLKVFLERFYKGKNCRAISEEMDRSHKQVYQFLSEAKRTIETECGFEIPESEPGEECGESLAEKFLFGAMDDDERREFENQAIKNELVFSTLSRVAFDETRLRRVAKYLGKTGKLSLDR